MPIYRTTLVNFTVFERAEFEFSRGINVLIGKNGTGKSHLLKALYGMTEGSRQAYGNNDVIPGISRKLIAESAQKAAMKNDLEQRYAPAIARGAAFKIFFAELYLSANSKRDLEIVDKALIRNCNQDSKAEKMTFLSCGFSKQVEEDFISVQFGEKIPPITSLIDAFAFQDMPLFLRARPIFLPPREVLTMYPGFTALYKKRQISFDHSYYELCEALSMPLLREVSPTFSQVLASLELAIGGRAVLRGDRFAIERKDGEIDANLEAEGLRKLAMIAHLIANGSLEPGGYLFWDEPEANMNPKLVVLIKDLLVGLAKAGVQVFIATHDYLLCSELSLFSEYASAEDKDLVKFFCLNKEKHTDPVTVESGAVLADLSHNPIMEEFTAHYEREAKLFAEKR